MDRPYEIVQTPSGEVYRIGVRGTQVMRLPLVFRGTAFDSEQRKVLGLTGLLPHGVVTLDGQVKRAYAQYCRQGDDLQKNVYLTSLRDRNEVLFYRLLTEHVEEMMPIIYTPTVGKAIERYSHEYRRPRGVFLSIDHQEDIEESLRNFGLASEDVDLIVATDSEGILGIGDWGVGGIEIAIGKLTVYIAAAGIHPRRVIPVVLDAGTDNQALLNDPVYLGNRHSRVRGERYEAFIDAYVTTAQRLFPNALLHWEDFGADNARPHPGPVRRPGVHVQRRHAGYGGGVLGCCGRWGRCGALSDAGAAGGDPGPGHRRGRDRGLASRGVRPGRARPRGGGPADLAGGAARGSHR